MSHVIFADVSDFVYVLNADTLNYYIKLLVTPMLVVASCLCLSKVGVLSKWLNGSSNIFLAWMLPSTYPTLCYKEIHVSVKIKGILPLELCLRLWT